MRLTRTQFLTTVAFSLAVHVAGAAIFIDPEDRIEIAGGSAASQLIIGTAFNDSVMAGETGESLDPVEPVEEVQTVTTAVVEPPTVEPLETVEPVTQAEMAPTPPDVLQPSEPATDLATTASYLQPLAPAADEPMLVPVTPEPVASETPTEMAAISPVNEVKPAEPEIAQPANVPVPIARPEPPKTKVAQVKPTKPVVKKSKEKRKTAKPKPKGDSGAQRVTASRSASGSATAKRNIAAGNAAVSNYPGKVASKLRRSLRYPREAKRKRIRGEVVVSFSVSANGGVSRVRIARSSGHSILDNAAREAVRRAAPFPRIPAGSGRSSWSFSVPLGFTR
ncbi:TonB family protein [Hoeflea sp.]|uniref:energy transducer TonB family protein n=1 Tax=Hoeflea sp. TaxID=1940281 RepID=UPI003748E93D